MTPEEAIELIRQLYRTLQKTKRGSEEYRRLIAEIRALADMVNKTDTQ